MKKLSKIVALLLASAMAMLKFTACSGGGGSADTQIVPRRATALRGFLRLAPAQSRPLVAPPREKAMPEDPQIFRHCKFRIIFPLLMRTAHAARISNRLFYPFTENPRSHGSGGMSFWRMPVIWI